MVHQFAKSFGVFGVRMVELVQDDSVLQESLQIQHPKRPSHAAAIVVVFDFRLGRVWNFGLGQHKLGSTWADFKAIDADFSCRSEREFDDERGST